MTAAAARSNILFDYFRGVPAMVQELEELGFEHLYLSVILEAEMYVGMKKIERRKTVETINGSYPHLPLEAIQQAVPINR